MRLPFVSRTAFELVTESRDREREIVTFLRHELHDLRAKYHQLRLEGREAPPPDPVSRNPAPIDPCVQAINAMAGADWRLRAAALQQLAADRANGEPDSVILDRIRTGVAADMPV